MATIQLRGHLQPNHPLYLVLAGLLAGLVMNAGEFFLNAVILSHDWEVAMVSLNRPPVGGAMVALLAAMTFALGIAVVWLYVALASRFGTGAWTASIAGLLAWCLSYGLGFGWSYVLGLVPARIYWTTVGWAMFEVPIGSLAGAWYYDRKSSSRKNI